MVKFCPDCGTELREVAVPSYSWVRCFECTGECGTVYIQVIDVRNTYPLIATFPKIRQLQVASQLDDLKVPPGNMLEPLLGDRQGQHSIRINRQFQICFRWTKADAEDVEIVDYH